MLVVRVAGIDDYGRLHQNKLSRLPGVTRIGTSFALRDVLEAKSRIVTLPANPKVIDSELLNALAIDSLAPLPITRKNGQITFSV